MLCAISGEAPSVPVASKKSGAVFEKRLIEAYIAENGKDPVTNEELSEEDLVALKTDRTVKPRPPQMTSIPSLLTAFQNEWDAIALERFSLQQQLEQTRRELSRALYENDAATRVIARIQKERDEAREALSKLSIDGASGAGADATPYDNKALSEELVGYITGTQEALSKTRRKRPVPEDWATAEEIGTFRPQNLDTAGSPPCRFISQHPHKRQLLHAAGQAPGSVAVFDVDKSTSASLDTKQEGQITSATWTQEGMILAGSSSGHLSTVQAEQSAAIAQRVHKAAVTSVSVHASRRILASTSLDQSFIFYDAASGAPLSRIRTDAPLTAGSFHPDGHLFAAGGQDGEIKIYETASGARAAMFALGGPVQNLSFSENGTWLAASVQDDNSVQIWDLRKGAMIHSLTAPASVNALDWDYTGQYLAVGTSEGVTVHNYNKAAKAWSESLQANVPTVAVTWGQNAKSLYGIEPSGTVFQLA